MTILFIHGAAGSPAVWRLQLHHFKTGVAIGLPGHPTGEACKTVEQYAAFVDDYIKKQHVKDLVLTGHSMGGAIALTLALNKIELSGLVLVGTGARLRVHPEIFAKIAENYPEACRLIAQRSVSPRSDPIIAGRLVEDMMKVRSDVALRDFMACDQFDRMSQVQAISCKTLVIVGEDDWMTPVKYSQYLHDRIASSKLVVIPRAGHSVMLEQHRMVNDALQAFLDSL